jgi:ankyrin repeat protein
MAGAPHWRPLHAAIEAMEDGGPLEMLALLLRHGATVDGWDRARDATPLLMAVFRGRTEAARLLLERGADANAVGGEGDSPLCWAAREGDVELARLLLEHGAGATIDAGRGVDGMNALGAAARQLNPAMVRLLLDAGARPDAEDADGLRAVDRVKVPVPTEAAESWEEIKTLLGLPPKS